MPHPFLDTFAAATDTIDYVATDQFGLTSTSTRTVIIEPPQSPIRLANIEHGLLNRELISRRAIVLWSGHPTCVGTGE